MNLDDVIHGNDIITFGVAVMENFNLISVVMTTNRKTKIIVFIIKVILINDNIAVYSRTYY